MTHRLRRRTLLGLAGALAGGGAYAATPNRSLDADRDRALINLRLRYRSDDGAFFWWMVGTKLGQVEAETTPLFDMHVGTIGRITHKPGGAFSVTSVEVVFYTDLKTGAQLKQWQNPYTGATVEVSHGPLGPETIAFGADTRKAIGPREVGGAIIDARAFDADAVVVGDDAWARTVSTVTVTQKSGTGRPFFVNEWVMYQGSAADVLAAGKPFIHARSQLHEITSWSKWMAMGTHPGNLTAKCIGAKVSAYGEMPDRWRALMSEAHPEIAKDPLGALDRPAAKLDR